MKPYFGSALFLLSLSAAHGASIPSSASAYENGAADPLPSADIDIISRLTDIQSPGTTAISSSLTMVGVMSNLQKHDSILSLLKRSYAEMNVNTISLFPRQAPPPDNRGARGASNRNIAAWDLQVNTACEGPIANLSTIVTQITDPAGVAVCYNIPFYDMTTGTFASDIRLYKIANGTEEWEAPSIKISLSVQYEGAMVQLAAAPNTGAADTARSNDLNVKRQMVVTAQPRLLQTLRFVGQVDSDVMQNETLRNDPNLMKLLLTPTLTLVGTDPAGTPMNASVAAAQVNYVSGAFANITAPEIVQPVTPFVLPGTVISIVPVGLYLFSVYMLLFVGIVGFGTWERYQFRMSYRRRASIRAKRRV